MARTRIVADDGNGVGRREIVGGCKVGNRLVRWQVEDQFDLAEVGGEAGTTTLWTEDRARMLAGQPDPRASLGRAACDDVLTGANHERDPRDNLGSAIRVYI